jgi:selenocysteine lyase/cysteine desulfurase
MRNLELYFSEFRKNIIGINQEFDGPYGRKLIHYADWIASGRLYMPIEKKLIEEFGPFVANTHTGTNVTGSLMTSSYHYAHKAIKKHVNASATDVIITAGFGMTSVVNKLQRILSLKGCSNYMARDCVKKQKRPVVFVSHMEHHSNHTSWYETIADVVQLNPDKDLLVDPEDLRVKLEQYKDREFKIGAFTACSNVTGIHTPYHQLARIMHENGGLCFIDFAASAPYEDINMNPGDPLEKLDAIYFSPHKFLGGPGSSGVLIFDSAMYHAAVPDNPGGGTVDWTNPWGKYKYVDDIEVREDGGTPGFLEAIKAALALELKNKMGTENILSREKELLDQAFPLLRSVPGISILADNDIPRLGILSFYNEKIHFNLLVIILNDKFGIQVRGGCACAGTYGHYLLQVSYEKSQEITDKINHGDLSEKPGWVRWSLHPTMTDDEVRYFIDSLAEITANIHRWEKDYVYLNRSNEFLHKKDLENKREETLVKSWFEL